jgi:flagellin
MINAARGNTGVFAVLTSGTDGSPAATDLVSIMSEEYGTAQKLSIETVSGDDITAAASGGAPAALAAGENLTASGVDIGANINGAYLATKGHEIKINSTFLNADIRIADGTEVTPAGAPLLFTVRDSGLDFQLNIEPTASDLITLGLPNISTNYLGSPLRTLGSGSETRDVGGYLNSLLAGGANDLTTDPGNAVYILDSSIEDVNALRGFLGAFASQTLESNLNSLGIAVENLTASESEIRDLDFAQEVADFTRSQILFSAGTSVLASANLIPQAILRLLQ